MTTRRKEKEQRQLIKEKKIKDIARRRSIGQDMKDNGCWHRKPNVISYTRREEKQLKKLMK